MRLLKMLVNLLVPLSLGALIVQGALAEVAKSSATIADRPLLRVVVPTRDISTMSDSHYFYPLLNLALSKTEATDGPFVTEYYPRVLSSARIIHLIKSNGGIDLAWTSTSEARERDMRFVPISLLGELSNYRVFIIRADAQPRFSAIETLTELKHMRIGIGGHWPDARLLANNGFLTITSIYYESLFTMLNAKRFDAFPRGLFEAWDDLERYGNPSLAIEQKIMLHYPAPFYFFINKNNAALADRLERGLRKAQQDGSFEALMMSIPAYKRGAQELNNKTRLIFTLVPDYSDKASKH